MMVEIETDYDNSTNKRIRYQVRSDGYVKGRNLTMTNAKELKRLLENSINSRRKLRLKYGVTEDRAPIPKKKKSNLQQMDKFFGSTIK